AQADGTVMVGVEYEIERFDPHDNLLEELSGQMPNHIGNAKHLPLRRRVSQTCTCYYYRRLNHGVQAPAICGAKVRSGVRGGCRRGCRSGVQGAALRCGNIER